MIISTKKRPGYGKPYFKPTLDRNEGPTSPPEEY